MASALQIIRDISQRFEPKPKRTVSESAARYVRIGMTGGYTGKWNPDLTPYLVEPLDTLSSRVYEAVIFVGPAQCGKTEALVLGWIGHIFMTAPADCMVVEKDYVSARDFSRRRVDRMFRNSPDLKGKLSPRRNDDNTFDKIGKEGIMLTFAWPSISQLSGKPVRYMMITDYDRLPADIDGNGDGFGLARKRTTTFMSGGMTLAESSPGGEIIMPDGKPAINWRQSTPHEAPPSPGIISLYNRTDRRGWYWKCPSCGEDFRPLFSLLHYSDTGTISERANSVVMPCPYCGSIITQEQKRSLNVKGRWIAEHEILGIPGVGHNMAGFWIEGPSAAFQTWDSLVMRYLQAFDEYERTGDERPLQSTTNTDQGRPYLSRRISAVRSVSEMVDKAESSLTKGMVPAGVRFLVAAVDVQSNRFVVQVIGFGVNRESWLVDRFDVALSRRGEEGSPESVQPATYGEDWDLLTAKVINAVYPLGDGSGRVMKIRLVGCDSAGMPGVTERAYDYWRRLRKSSDHSRFLLIKGGESNSAPRVRVSYPDATNRSARKSNAKGDVPVLLLNSNSIKDAVHSDLQRPQPGPGYIHLPRWVADSFWGELTSETRTKRGWEKMAARNEAWDLICYARALAIHLGIDTWGDLWRKAPAWAQGWDENPLVCSANENGKEPIKVEDKPKKNMSSTRSGWLGVESKSWV